MTTFNAKPTLAITLALSATAGACGLWAPDNYLLTCEDLNGTIRKYCVPKEKLCSLGSAVEACSWNWHGELGHNDQFEGATWSDDPVSCPGDALDGATPKNGKDTCGGAPPNASATAGEGGEEGGGSSTGEPACEEDPTTGGMDTFLCSLLSPVTCLDITPDNHLASVFGDDPYPVNTAKDVCWAPIETDPLPAKQISICVAAADEAAARVACQQDCSMFNQKVKDECTLKGCTVVKELDCTLNGSVEGDPDDFEKPHKYVENCSTWRCPDGFDMLPAWDGVSEFTYFTAGGSAIMSDGTVVGASAIDGYIGFTLSNCNPTSCQITIDALEGLTRYTQGGYTDAAGSGGTYELENMGFRTRTAFTGTWDKARRTVSFPGAVVEAQFWASTAYIDGLPVPFGARRIEIDQIVGLLGSETGPLTLNLAYNLGFGTISISLTSQ